MPLHTIAPVFDADSRVLILGSFPSVKSRADGFYYAHPQNRFWRVLAAVWGEAAPEGIPEKRAFLLRNRIALWDVIGACEIDGSSDASIRAAVPNDLRLILDAADIRAIFLNGRTAQKYYDKYARPLTGRPAQCLPSTSPANATWSLERLIQAWSQVRAAPDDAKPSGASPAFPFGGSSARKTVRWTVFSENGPASPRQVDRAQRETDEVFPGQCS